MIDSLRGKLLKKSPTEVVVDVVGVGYRIYIPLSVFQKLPEVGDNVNFYTHLHVRDDAMQLFGFIDDQQKELFRQLITVSGVGPKLAQVILSGLSNDELVLAIKNGDVNLLSSIPGVGKKSAERLAFELRDRIEKSLKVETGIGTLHSIQSEAMIALTALEYTRSVSEKAILAAISEKDDTEPTLETLIKNTLRHIKSAR